MSFEYANFYFHQIPSGYYRLHLTSVAMRYLLEPTALFFAIEPICKLKAGDLLAIVESEKAALDLCIPLACSCMRINQQLQHNPSALLNEEGWLAELILEEAPPATTSPGVIETIK